MFYEKNTAALAQSALHESLLTALQQTEAASDMEVLQAADGSITLQYQGAYLHSPAGTIQEAKAICDAHCRPGKEATHVLLGLGLGYLLKEVFERSAGTIFVYDPNLPVLRFVFENVDLTPYLASNRVFVAHTREALQKQIRASYIFGDSLDILMLDGYAQLFKEDIQELSTLLSNNILHAKMHLATLVLQHYKWLEGFFRNLPQLKETLPFDLLANRFARKPAVVISRGPSLDQAIEDLKALQDKVVTIAVGGALRPLLAAGIVPDFAVFADHQGMEHQLKDLSQGTEEINFLLTPFTQKCCFETPAKHKFLLLIRNHSDYTRWLDETLGVQHLQTRGGGSVSLASFHAAVAMGCNPVILLGQDLALQGNRFYAGGTPASITADGMVDVPKSETINGSQYRMAEIKGQDGTLLKTTSHYLLFANQFMEIAADNAKAEQPLQFINASMGGAWLEGFRHQSLKEFSESTILSPLPKEPLCDASALSSVERNSKLHEGVHQLITACQQTIRHAATIQEVLRKMVASPQSKWGSLVPPYSKAREAYEKLLAEHPFLPYCLTLETLNLNRTAQAGQPLEEELRQVAAYFENCQATLQNKILPWALEAERHMAEGQTLEATVPPKAFSGPA